MVSTGLGNHALSVKDPRNNRMSLAMNTEVSNTSDTVALSESSLPVVVTMIANIVEMACEHEPDLGLMRLVNFMDLYRTYLMHELDTDYPDSNYAGNEHAGLTRESSTVSRSTAGRRMTECVSFEHFIGDPHLLQIAALAASRDTGVVVTAPLPLKLSANSTRSAD